MSRPLTGAALLLALCAGLAAAQDKPKEKAAPRGRGKADPIPGYEIRTVQGFRVIFNKKCLEEAAKAKGMFVTPPLEVFEEELRALEHILVPKLYKVLQGVTIWVEWDDEADLPEAYKGQGTIVAVYRGGTVAQVAREGKAHPLKAGCVEVVSLKTLAALHQPDRPAGKIVMLHELCHVIHHIYMSFENRDVKAAYAQAMDRKLYDDVYARVNDREYFAEIACAYLDRCNRFPHTAEELQNHDRVGFALMERTFGKLEDIAKAKEKAAKEAEARAKSRKVLTVAPQQRTTAAAAEPTKDADPEKAAAGKLELIKALVKDGKTERAKERLRELIQAYPNTKAAEEAKKLLDDLK